uniref:RNA polymerase II C-terminal domain phosphatase-like 1 n=1 Tax=Rhizophora mucronata TaxID=61149 RepID=A0A2P2LPU4_RHIMU
MESKNLLTNKLHLLHSSCIQENKVSPIKVRMNLNFKT